MGASRREDKAWVLAGLLLAVLLDVINSVSARTWAVGDGQGWSLGVDFTQWPDGKSFKPGDVLYFAYSEGQHSVMEVSKTDHDTCTTARPFASYTGGNTSISLKNKGTYYFICGVPGHCLDGMALTISVETEGSSPSTAPGVSPEMAPTISTPTASSWTSPSPSPAPGMNSSRAPAELPFVPPSYSLSSMKGPVWWAAFTIANVEFALMAL